MKVNKKNSMYVILFLLLTCCFVSCSKDEGDVTDTYANELRAKLIGTWINGHGNKQFVFESSGTASWTFWGKGWEETSYYKFKVGKYFSTDNYYSLMLEDIGYGDGPHLEIKFISDNEVKLGGPGTIYYRK